MNSAVEEIKSRINIVDLIGEYVRLSKAGANWRARCPFHNEKTPSFMVSEEKQIWHCFGCGKGGDVFGFLMEQEGLEFKEALKILADKAGIQLQRYDGKAADDKNKIMEILELATKFYEKQLWDGAGKGKIMEYLRQRGLKNETIKDFRLGYAPAGWRNLLNFLLGKEYEIEEIAKTGLLVQKETNNPQPTTHNQAVSNYYDRFRDRIIFPVADVMGKVVGFSARVAPGGDESQAKYVNTPETVAYHKSKILYGIDKAKQEIKSRDFTVLVEGNLDVIASHQAGIKNTVAVSGTALTSDQLEILKRYSDSVKMFFDADPAGEGAAKKSILLAFEKGFNAEVVDIGEGKDAAELAAKDPAKLIASVEKAIPAMEYFFNKSFAKYDSRKAEGKKKIAGEILNAVSFMENEVEKSHWIKNLAGKLEVAEKSILDTLKKIKSGARENYAGEKEVPGGESGPALSRSEMIRDKITGLMLADRLVWKKVLEYNSDDIINFLKNDELFRIIFEKGRELDFEFGKLTEEYRNSEIDKKAQRLFFEAKYQFDAREGVKENELRDGWLLAEHYIKELEKEICRGKLKMIERDIKKAEEEGDKNAAVYLMREFSKITKDLENN
ncbi:MAG: DNA primase [Candidatus Moranbacteria bacterium RIFCSPHIGHO2_02_FULL_40_12b]|nr:MAG: DNA primase [Candidatus Moranbacteria bacterium RIFCSPHIGHO2_02_FULL_40_12b]OGI24150.1 MAG: DNA primase [Candidatus Moranbacteria bacterium RIFCSPHIGHO2_12_FULL_40_10]